MEIRQRHDQLALPRVLFPLELDSGCCVLEANGEKTIAPLTLHFSRVWLPPLVKLFSYPTEASLFNSSLGLRIQNPFFNDTLHITCSFWNDATI